MSYPPPVTSPPIIRPEEWGEHPAFRELFLLFFTDPQANATLRRFGGLLHEFVLEFWHMWPSHPEGRFAAEMRAAVADLRHVQGALQEWTVAYALESAYEIRLTGVGAEVAAAIGELADRLERELGPRKGDA